MALLLAVAVVACRKEEQAVVGVAHTAAESRAERRRLPPPSAMPIAPLLAKSAAPHQEPLRQHPRPPEWKNPFISVDAERLDLRVIQDRREPQQNGQGGTPRPEAARRQELQIRPDDLTQALIALPGPGPGPTAAWSPSPSRPRPTASSVPSSAATSKRRSRNSTISASSSKSGRFGKYSSPLLRALIRGRKSRQFGLCLRQTQGDLVVSGWPHPCVARWPPSSNAGSATLRTGLRECIVRRAALSEERGERGGFVNHRALMPAIAGALQLRIACAIGAAAGTGCELRRQPAGRSENGAGNWQANRYVPSMAIRQHPLCHSGRRHGDPARPGFPPHAEVRHREFGQEINGVKNVINDIEVLPLFPNDDNLRAAVYRSMYGYPALRKITANRGGGSGVPSVARAAGGVADDPPIGFHAIHIIVKNGNIIISAP